MRKVLRFGAFSLALSLGLTGCSDLFGSGDEATPAVLEAYSPGDGAFGVSVLSPVTAEFSRKVDLISLSEGVRLLDGGRALLVSLDLDSNGNTVTTTPSGPLDFGTEYRVEVTSGLGFMNGMNFSGPQAWAFTTEGTAPLVPEGARMLANLEVLAHDSMEGRDSGSGDELRAAQYLVQQFQSHGLQEPPGGFVQDFSAWANRFDREIDSQNVMAAVPGSGTLAGEWVVVGAHYDHIGYRSLADGSQGPNNGADDNGSGTVSVLEMARKFKDWTDAGGSGSRDRRSVLFVLFGAEEQGLLGSCSYVFDSPAIPIQQTRAMMNFDMVGRLRDNTVYVSGIDASSGMAPLVTNANEPGLTLSIRPESCTGCTDHACFWRAGVPFVGFYTGTHDEYHRPGDDVELINVAGMERIGELAFRILARLVVMPDPPGLTKAYPTG